MSFLLNGLPTGFQGLTPLGLLSECYTGSSDTGLTGSISSICTSS